jgi:glycosyltransferase involved in cell wall biosynthesis
VATARPLVAAFIGAEVNTIPEIGYGMRTDPFYDRQIRRLMKRADRALYVSDFLFERARVLGAPASNSRIVRNAVDGDRFAAAGDREAIRRELGLDSRPVILTVAGLVPVKGVNYLLEAAALVRDSQPFTLVIAGEGEDAGRLRQLATRLSLGDRTKFVGRIPPEVIPRYFTACDIFALGSLVESAGIVLLEAMAAGRPVVCTNAGGPSEYVQDEVTGFIVPPADPPAMAAKLRLLLERPDLRERLGSQGRVRVNRCFPYAKRVRELRESYLEAMRHPGRMAASGSASVAGGVG